MQPRLGIQDFVGGTLRISGSWALLDATPRPAKVKGPPRGGSKSFDLRSLAPLGSRMGFDLTCGTFGFGSRRPGFFVARAVFEVGEVTLRM